MLINKEKKYIHRTLNMRQKKRKRGHYYFVYAFRGIAKHHAIIFE